MPRILASTLGAPGVYRLPPARRQTALGVPMDVAAFVGVAPRGPAREPAPTEGDDSLLVEDVDPRARSVAVPVESFDEYRRHFGGFDGPGRLPYAVASFFEQGGRRAYVVRVVHDYGDATQNMAARAAGTLSGVDANGMAVQLLARNEGSWGNALRASLGFTLGSLPPLLEPDSAVFDAAAPLLFDPGAPLVEGALLRLHFADPAATPDELRFVSVLRDQADPVANRHRLLVTLDQPLTEQPLRAELIEAELLIDDAAGMREHHARLGLAPEHPRWAARVLYASSELVWPHADWTERDLLPTGLIPRAASLRPGEGDPFDGGEDRYTDIIHEDFLDRAWTPAEVEPGVGIAAVARLGDVATLVVPDLYVAESLQQAGDDEPSGSIASASFQPCATAIETPDTPLLPEAELPGLMLDPNLPDELDEIIALQRSLVAFAELHRGVIVLLDVPPGLSQRSILDWRTRFDSAFAAAYHPWLRIARADDARDGPVALNPSAAAAGIIAAQELTFGLPHGPANRLAAEVFDVTDRVSPARHDELHPQGINVYLRERDGIRLSAARTLSRDRRWRQLSVRRLMIMLARALHQQMQWVVFEPNDESTWRQIRARLRAYLGGLFQAGALRGGSEAEAFFVRCDATLNDRRALDAGRLFAEVGVAPAEPLEYIVLRITRGGDGTLSLEDQS